MLWPAVTVTVPKVIVSEFPATVAPVAVVIDAIVSPADPALTVNAADREAVSFATYTAVTVPAYGAIVYTVAETEAEPNATSIDAFEVTGIPAELITAVSVPLLPM
jgi:hypothetical protein